MERKRIPYIEEILIELKDDLRINPNYADLHNKLGILLIMTGKDKEGERHFLKAININPKYWHAILNLGFFYLSKGMWRKAEKIFIKDSTKNRDTLIYFFIGKFYLQMLILKQNLLDIIGLDKKDFSIKEFYSNNVGLQRKIFEVFQRVENLLKNIIENYLKAEFHNILGLYFAKRGKTSWAIQEFKKSSKIKPDDFTLHLNFARLYYYKGDYKRAIEEYKKAIKINPDYGIGYAEIGYIYGLMKRMDDAQRYMEKAVNINPNYADLHYNLALIYSDRKNYVKAIEEFKKALRINPNYIFSRINLGVLYEEQNMLNEAKREYQKVLKINPNDEHVRVRLQRISKNK